MSEWNNTSGLPEFSIIVPIYNGASVVERCIKSILAQTYEQYELLLIDDGSVDATGPICQHWANKDKRIKYFRQINRGVSATRNVGLTKAQNEFILFVDADDFLTSNSLQSYLHLLQNGGPLAKRTLYFQDFMAEILEKDGSQKSFKWCAISYKECSLGEAFQQLPQYDWLPYGVPFAKLFRLSIIRQHGVAFKESITFKEDSIFLLEYLQYIDTIVFDPTATYCYTIDKRKQSLSSTVASFASESLFFVHFKQLADFFIQKFSLSTTAKQVLYYTLYISYFRALNSCLYQHKTPLLRQQRLKNIRSLSTMENLTNLERSGVVNGKMKQLAFLLLKTKQYYLYDLLNSVRYRYMS